MLSLEELKLPMYRSYSDDEKQIYYPNREWKNILLPAEQEEPHSLLELCSRGSILKIGSKSETIDLEL